MSAIFLTNTSLETVNEAKIATAMGLQMRRLVTTRKIGAESMWIRNGSPSTTPNKRLLIRNSLLRAGSVEFIKKNRGIKSLCIDKRFNHMLSLQTILTWHASCLPCLNPAQNIYGVISPSRSLLVLHFLVSTIGIRVCFSMSACPVPIYKTVKFLIDAYETILNE